MTKEVPMSAPAVPAPPAVAVANRHTPAVLTAAALTFVGVPAGLAITGGNVQGVMTFSPGDVAGVAGPVPAAVAADRADRLGAVRRGVAVGVPDRHRLGLAGHRGVRRAGARRPAPHRGGGRRRAPCSTASPGTSSSTWTTARTGRSAHVGGEALWLAAVLAAAHAYRNTRRWQAEVAARLAQDAHERELDARRRRAEERVDIARDLHDVVSHTLAVVGRAPERGARLVRHRPGRGPGRRCGWPRTSAAGR